MGTTANYSWPTPVATDLVKDGWEAIKDLGDAADTTVKAVSDAQGLVHINTTTMSAVASQSVNNVFTSTYDDYRIVLSELSLSTTIQAFSLRLRKAGTDNSSNIYVRQQLSASAGTVNGSRGTSTSWVIGGVSSNGVNNIIIDIFNPNKASQYTQAFAYFSQGAISTPELLLNAYQHDLTSSADFDGFSVFPATGNVSGRISVFAYKK